ncbi:hypothetical protein NUW54_g11039 [Trametes sanguinea]|uniref:Uncharacterized protein n=1 Tax=Trametes sanguinea TaxID=158606 RepID=A0ACC1NMQ2_9APHY|nr:hypothetical protein NUW54_g11039 [Trametes sanguinea]
MSVSESEAYIAAVRTICNVIGYMVIVGNLRPPLILAVFSTLGRGYALSGRKWWIAPPIFVFYVPHFTLNCLYYAKLKPQLTPPPFNCLLSSSIEEQTWNERLWVRAREEYLAATDYMSGSADSDTIGSRTCLIVGDLIVLAMTWCSTFGITKAAKCCANAPVTDECHSERRTIYFVRLLILNVVNIVVNAVAVRDSVPFQGAAYGQVPVSKKTASI